MYFLHSVYLHVNIDVNLHVLYFHVNLHAAYLHGNLQAPYLPPWEFARMGI